jgi:thioester reductase-like protein
MASNGAHTRGFNLDAEAYLDPAIVPQGGPVDLSAPLHAILLTGATGFVGAYLLRDLLAQTDADIYCLVRAASPEHGLERVRKNLQSYGIWDDSLAQRVRPLLGDLKLPLLGLDEADFNALAEKLDSIYHCGSKLSYIAPYDWLKAPNVGGTQEALRLAVRGKPKPLHFVSSLGILLAYRNLEGGGEAASLDADKCPDVGYFQTKYVAEAVVRLARDRGIPVTIHRIGLIVGDSRTGASNVDDFVARMLIGSIHAGRAPDVKSPMDMTPVDFVSQAMVYLSRQPESLGKVFHLLNPRPITWSSIFDMVIEAGYPVKKLPFSAWVDAVEQYANPESNPLYPLLPFFHIDFARRMLGVSDSAFMALGTADTQRALAQSGIICPAINDSLIFTFLSQFAYNGRLEWEPVRRAELSAVRVAHTAAGHGHMHTARE